MTHERGHIVCSTFDHLNSILALFAEGRTRSEKGARRRERKLVTQRMRGIIFKEKERGF